MQAATPYLPARYYAVLCARLADWGVDWAKLLHDAGIAPEVLQAADGQLQLEQVESLIALATQHTRRTDLGFELGRRLKLSSHDILGYAILSAPTLDYAQRLIARYFSLITPTFGMQYRVGAGTAQAVFQPRLSLSPLAFRFHTEVIAVAYYETLRTLLAGDLPACTLHLSFEPPPHAARYHELQTAVVHFGEEASPGTRLVIEQSLVQRPLVLADGGALQMAEARCAALLASIAHRSSLGDWLQMMMREAADKQPSLEELARILNLSPRTVERRLAREGCRFRELAQRARMKRARDLLEAGRLTVTQIAYQLGYGDVANFTRAFRRDAGIAPSEYQRRSGRFPGGR